MGPVLPGAHSVRTYNEAALLKHRDFLLGDLSVLVVNSAYCLLPADTGNESEKRDRVRVRQKKGRAAGI